MAPHDSSVYDARRSVKCGNLGTIRNRESFTRNLRSPRIVTQLLFFLTRLKHSAPRPTAMVSSPLHLHTVLISLEPQINSDTLAVPHGPSILVTDCHLRPLSPSQETSAKLGASLSVRKPYAMTMLLSSSADTNLIERLEAPHACFDADLGAPDVPVLQVQQPKTTSTKGPVTQATANS